MALNGFSLSGLALNKEACLGKAFNKKQETISQECFNFLYNTTPEGLVTRNNNGTRAILFSDRIIYQTSNDKILQIITKNYNPPWFHFRISGNLIIVNETCGFKIGFNGEVSECEIFLIEKPGKE